MEQLAPVHVTMGLFPELRCALALPVLSLPRWHWFDSTDAAVAASKSEEDVYTAGLHVIMTAAHVTNCPDECISLLLYTRLSHWECLVQLVLQWHCIAGRQVSCWMFKHQADYWLWFTGNLVLAKLHDSKLTCELLDTKCNDLNCTSVICSI